MDGIFGCFMFCLRGYYKPFCLFIFIGLLSAGAVGDENIQLAKAKLAYVIKFAKVAPERSRHAMIQYAHLSNYLDEADQLVWYATSAKVANRLNDIGLMEHALKQLFSLPSMRTLSVSTISHLTLLGHFALKSEYFIDASRAYYCVFDSSETKDGKLRGAYMIANSYLSLGNIEMAEQIMTRLYAIAKANNKSAWFGAMQSALGIYALHRKDYVSAASYFRQSMTEHQKQNKYSGEFNSALNLLLTFALANNDKYQRLLPRVVRLSSKNGDSDRKQLIELIKILRKVKMDVNQIKQVDKLAIDTIMASIQSSTVKAAARNFILPELFILPEPFILSAYPDGHNKKSDTNKELYWMQKVLDDYQCTKENIDVIKQLNRFEIE